mmetsp:Transcript_779/g.1020  ORF Transcript_779/g.1020 Transcript_779/m.1020 type:complete len:267 (+) Transcript_779:439-1239(+)
MFFVYLFLCVCFVQLLNKIFPFQVACISCSRQSIKYATAQYSLQHGNTFLYFFETQDIFMPCIGSNIQDIVGNISPRLINLLNNVQIFMGKGICNFSQHSRYILIHNGKSDSATGSVSQGRGGEIDGIANSTRFQKFSNRIHGHGTSGIFGFGRAGTQMWQQNHIWMIPQCIVGEIGHVPCGRIGIQKFLHGVRIHQFSASKIHQNSIGFEMSNGILANNTMCPTFFDSSFDIRNINRNIIGIRHGRCNGICQGNVAWQLQSRMHR